MPARSSSDLEQPVAIVTGGSRGIGRGIAKELASTHRVIATYRGREDAAHSLQEETGVEILRVDVTSAADREALLCLLPREVRPARLAR